ncbi:MAG: hypothetical protein ACPGRH_01275 [Alphaproteobacteria bacterium]
MRPKSYRLAAAFLLLVGIVLGISVIVSTGANSSVKQILGFATPTLTGFGFAIVWWQKSAGLIS